jgi:hypothetical protein
MPSLLTLRLPQKRVGPALRMDLPSNHLFSLVPEERLELSSPRGAGDFESPASTNSATPAHHAFIGPNGPVVKTSVAWLDNKKRGGVSPPRPVRRGVSIRVLAQNGLEVLFRSADGLDGEVVHQHLKHGRGDEGGQGGPQADILDAQEEQGQQDGHRLLLIP